MSGSEIKSNKLGVGNSWQANCGVNRLGELWCSRFFRALGKGVVFPMTMKRVHKPFYVDIDKSVTQGDWITWGHVVYIYTILFNSYNNSMRWVSLLF